MTPAEKAERLADIQKAILDGERREAALIDAAALEGQDIPYRPNTSPEAILGITIAKKAKAATAA